MKLFSFSLLSFGLSLFSSVLALADPIDPADPVLVVWPDHADGVYALNETATWTVDVKGDRTAPGLSAVPYVVKRDGLDAVARGTLDLSAGPAAFTATRGEPGALYALLSSPGSDHAKTLALGGAVFAPERLGPALPAPDDFDAFWQEKLRELAAVPANAVTEKGSLAGVPNAEGLDYCKVTLDNVRGTHVRGQLLRPSSGEKFPAILMLQYAGVYPLEKTWAARNAKEGYLVLNIEAHDIPIDAPPASYDALKEGALKDYVFQGNEDRDTSYFVRMFLGCVQAAEYLASRPDWDGRTLIVAGDSQGGLQSFATAALCPRVTQMMVLVPAGCDNYGPLAVPPRAFGWPYWLSGWGPKGDAAKIRKTAGYFDAIYFAARVRCPALVGVGLLDDTARPAGVFAAYNAIPGAEKEIVVLPLSDHKGTGADNPRGAYFTRVSAWREAIRKGGSLPPE